MTPLTASLIATAVQAGLLVAIAADRWVHKITGPSPLQARVEILERQLEAGNARSSKKASELTIYLDQRRHAADLISERVAAIEGELRSMRNQRSDGSLIQNRRHDDRRRD